MTMLRQCELSLAMAVSRLSNLYGRDFLTSSHKILKYRLLGWDRDTLVFLTHGCATAFTPKDGIVAHDMEDERFAEWMSRAERWNKPASPVE
jgi:hypothetical protein